MKGNEKNLIIFRKSAIIIDRILECNKLAERSEFMNEVITKLYEIEETAGQILKEAGRYKEQLQHQLDMEKKAYDKKIEQDLTRKLEAARDSLKEQAETEIKQQQMEYQKQLENLNETYDAHLDELAEEIFQRITEV